MSTTPDRDPQTMAQVVARQTVVGQASGVALMPWPTDVPRASVSWEARQRLGQVLRDLATELAGDQLERYSSDVLIAAELLDCNNDGIRDDEWRCVFGGHYRPEDRLVVPEVTS